MQTKKYYYKLGVNMTIFKNLKDTGLNLYLFSHPFIKQVKREAKLLKKINKTKDQKGLMALQNKVSSEYGFNNFHHLLQTLKNQHISSGLSNQYNFVKKQLEKESKSPYGHFYLGYDIVYQKPVFQSLQSSLIHNLIIGPTIYNKFDLKLAEQAIEKNCSVFFLNFENKSILEQIKHLSINHKRLLDFYPIGKEYNTIPNNFLKYAPGFLTQLFLPDEEFDLAKFKNFSSNIFSLLKHNQNLRQLTIEDIFKFVNEEEYFKIDKLGNKDNIFLENLSDLYNTNNNDYKYFHSILTSKVNHILNLGIFSNKNDIPFETLRELNKIVLVDNYENAKVITQLISNMIFMELSTPPFNYKSNFNSPFQISKSNPMFLFLRGIQDFHLISLLQAQARSRKISINISIPQFLSNKTPTWNCGTSMIESCEINKYLETIEQKFDIKIKEDNVNTDLFFIFKYVHMTGHEHYRCSISKSLLYLK